MSYGGYPNPNINHQPNNGYPAPQQPNPNINLNQPPPVNYQPSTAYPPQQQNQPPMNYQPSTAYPPQQQGQYPPPPQQGQYPPQQQYPPPQQPHGQYPPPQQQYPPPPQQGQYPPQQQYPPPQQQYPPPQQPQPPYAQQPPANPGAPAPNVVVNTLNGILEITVMSSEYPKRGFFRGFGNDPYVKVSIGSNNQRTKIFKGPEKATAASWFEKFDFNISGPIAVQFQVLDQDDLTPDSLIGMCSVDVNMNALPDGNPQWVAITKRDRITPAGRLQFSMRIRPPTIVVQPQYAIPQVSAPVYTAAPQVTVYQTPVVRPVYAAPAAPVVYTQTTYAQPAAVVYQQPGVVYQQPGVVYQQPGVYYR